MASPSFLLSIYLGHAACGWTSENGFGSTLSIYSRLPRLDWLELKMSREMSRDDLNIG